MFAFFNLTYNRLNFLPKKDFKKYLKFLFNLQLKVFTGKEAEKL